MSLIQYTSGKQKRVTVRSKNLADFKEKLKDAQNLQKNGYDFDTKNLTVADWARKWFKIYKEPKVDEGTAVCYETDIRKHIIPTLGHYKLTDVKPIALQEFLNGYAGQSTSHVRKLMMTLKQIFKKAFVEGMIVKDISVGLEMPETVAGTRRPLTDEELKAVEKATETHHAGLWVLTMLYAGLRPEETVSLMWNDFDFTEGEETVTIERAAKFSKNKAVLKKPKKKENKSGEEARRTIPLCPALVEKLKAAPRKGLYVFPPAESDGMMSKTNLHKLWHSFHREVDLLMGAEVYRNKIIAHVFPMEVTPYYLRHTCCTHWFEIGLDLKTVQYLMGHTNISTTANIYTHFMSRSLDKAGRIIRGKIISKEKVEN